jgi:hypothetical protein
VGRRIDSRPSASGTSPFLKGGGEEPSRNTQAPTPPHPNPPHTLSLSLCLLFGFNGRFSFFQTPFVRVGDGLDNPLPCVYLRGHTPSLVVQLRLSSIWFQSIRVSALVPTLVTSFTSNRGVFPLLLLYWR